MSSLAPNPSDGSAVVTSVTPQPGLMYQLVSALVVFPLFRGLLRGRTSGNALVPLQGPLVVVANHGSHLDPPLLGHALGRPVSFMAKAELFRVPILGAIIRACGAYPVKRGASDREAIRTATARLTEGWAIGVFLDGTRQTDGRVNEPRPGAALLAARSGAPLLPVAIINTHRALGAGRSWPRLVPVELRIGEPMPAPTGRRKPELEATTRELQRRINALIDQGVGKP